MRILVLSNAFVAPNLNARLRFQCDYFTSQGHLVEVYTELWDKLKFEHEYPIHEIGDSNVSYLKWLMLSIYSLLTNYKERKFAYKVLWLTRKRKFDVIYCSTDSCFPLCAATRIAKLKRLPLHVDISELMELQPNYEKATIRHPLQALRQTLHRHRRNQALRKAQSVSTVSPAHEEFLKAIHPNVTLLYNGYKPDKFYFAPVPTETFKICYIGYAYSSQPVDLILNVMDKLNNELPKAQWVFYSNTLEYNHIKHSRPNVCGLLPNEVLGESLRQASLLLLFNDTEDNGLLSRPFYQALGTEKPVLFTPSSTGMIPDLIRFTNLGLSTDNMNECMDYIRNLYHQWEKDGYTHQQVQNKELFDGDKQTQRLIQCLNQLIHK